MGADRALGVAGASRASRPAARRSSWTRLRSGAGSAPGEPATPGDGRSAQAGAGSGGMDDDGVSEAGQDVRGRDGSSSRSASVLAPQLIARPRDIGRSGVRLARVDARLGGVNARAAPGSAANAQTGPVGGASGGMGRGRLGPRLGMGLSRPGSVRAPTQSGPDGEVGAAGGRGHSGRRRCGSPERVVEVTGRHPLASNWRSAARGTGSASPATRRAAPDHRRRRALVPCVGAADSGHGGRPGPAAASETMALRSGRGDAAVHIAGQAKPAGRGPAPKWKTARETPAGGGAGRHGGQAPETGNVRVDCAVERSGPAARASAAGPEARGGRRAGAPRGLVALTDGGPLGAAHRRPRSGRPGLRKSRAGAPRYRGRPSGNAASWSCSRRRGRRRRRSCPRRRRRCSAR